MSLPRRSREDIVITGIACCFAKAANPATLWRNIMQRETAFQPLPIPTKNEKGLTRKTIFDRPFPVSAGLLDELYAVNPSVIRDSKKNATENAETLFSMQLIVDALRNSGIAVNRMPTDCISLHIGYSQPFNTASVSWLQHTLFMEQTRGIISKLTPWLTTAQIGEIQAQLDSALPSPSPDLLLLAKGSAMLDTIAQQLGFAGPLVAVDSCALSGLQAVQGAMDDLIMRRADIAIAGAVQPPLNHALLQGLAGTLPFSRGKSLYPFSRQSDGTLPGEGGAVFVLKRLKDAVRHGDRIYALIRGTGSATGVTYAQQQVPAPVTVQRAITRACHSADTEPASLSFIEAHGSGVPHSDTTELQAFQEILSTRTTSQPLVAVGSIKGNIGHTLTAAGAAGMLKAAMAIYRRVLPPQVEVEKPRPQLTNLKSPLYLLGEPRPWIRGGSKNSRRACVSAITLTGSCGAVILEEYVKEK